MNGLQVVLVDAGRPPPPGLDSHAQAGTLSFELYHGKERVIAILEAGEFCGEGCLADQLLSISTATTMTDCVIVRLEKAAVTRALHEDLGFSEFFVSYLLSRNVRLSEDLIDHLFNSSERRLARVLLLLANYEKNRQDADERNSDQKVKQRGHLFVMSSGVETSLNISETAFN